MQTNSGFGRSIILDVAITGIDGQSRPTEESPDRHLQVRYDQKIAKYGNLANTSGFQLIPAVFFSYRADSYSFQRFY